ncbi:sporulation-specific diadenylate cyclase CdaS [Priestia aryabhattai]|uniref:sporulation-specific diadenylate cyclase CdaS n=1 Tax=Priestia aryabhattai TaxID=412384 RepID=UPI0008DE78AC|nr:sporulation-specific diadenylate cyclase CdaS [Priestia aryabhattai]MBZ6484353.1 DNA integrity scanning protein DisA nucleotide-binding domain protein [Priestia aryabhattai]MDH3112151.1 sporulation-specific diadenylate cyclase CdaS [Priestia aryabhattai]MDH3128933.1 sporulation-specific diadenylate cyclase CdaS [Priestia aryabhattai]MDH3130861.1 sporulation-specific diadenylate cyclase CdaS [Priestia aryabhattai]MED4155227.1 sporulation-specific diadenylate cyclase CdaS [Priestia aryabhatta
MERQSFQLDDTIKNNVRTYLQRISTEASNLIKHLDTSDHCILCDFEEMRRLFQDVQATAASYYLRHYLSPYTFEYAALSLAIHNLSEKRHGALIVIEREQNVDPLIQKGMPIQAPVSATLVETLFYPGTPLHDGAVLIRNNQLISAANVLPLSSIISTNKKLGTRHRAAIGMSEKSDALILVVSEETGKISFALDGSLYPIHSSKNMI